VGISTSPRFARLIRGTVLSIKARDYVEAARATGASSTRMLVRHVLPNTISTLIVMASLRTGAAILTEGILGARYISLLPGADEDMLADGDEIMDTQGALVLENLIGDLVTRLGAS